ncbi:MAG: D-alanine--D-alanine ligase [bacterium]
MRVVVLCGGDSGGWVVSLASGDAVGQWLAQAGYEVVKLNPSKPERSFRADEPMAPPQIGAQPPDAPPDRKFDPSRVLKFLSALEKLAPDMAFPILHGGWGEDGRIQGVLEWVGLAYTGSGPLACALAMHKQKAKDIWDFVGIRTPKGIVVSQHQIQEHRAIDDALGAIGLPAVFKPLRGGSTIGLTIVREESEVAAAVQSVTELGEDLLIETFISGREITATILGDEPMPLIEIRPHEGLYDYHNKYTSGRSDYLCPAPLEDAVTNRIKEAALLAYRALDCRGFARVDFLLTPESEAYCLELNTLPGMTQHSLVPKAARGAGIEPPELVDRIVREAYGR